MVAVESSVASIQSKLDLYYEIMRGKCVELAVNEVPALWNLEVAHAIIVLRLPVNLRILTSIDFIRQSLWVEYALPGITYTKPVEDSDVFNVFFAGGDGNVD